MPTLVRQEPAQAKTQTGTAAAANALTIVLTPTPPAGQRASIDSVTVTFSGTTQQVASWNIQDSGGGVTYMAGHVAGTAAGIGTGHFTYPGGAPMPVATAVELSVGALTNCEIRGVVVWHLERAS